LSAGASADPAGLTARARPEARPKGARRTSASGPGTYQKDGEVSGRRARLRRDDYYSPYSQGMADAYNALDKHLGVTEQDHLLRQFARHRALVEHAGQALAAQNYAAAQAYALLMIVEGQENRSIAVHLTDWEDLAIGIAAHIAPDLRKIADAIDQLDS
jgi:hypothetical protein